MAIKTNTFLVLPEIATPSNAAADTARLYLKSDGKIYKILDAGSEAEVGGGGSGGTEATVQTTDATETSLFTVTIAADNTVTFVDTIIIAVRSDGSKQLAGRVCYAAYRDGAGAVELIGNNFLVQNAWDTAVFTKCEFDVSGNDIRFRVKGLAATTINWKALYSAVTQAA